MNLISPNKPLAVGQRVHCILYGGRDGVIVNIEGVQNPASCSQAGGVMVMGGEAYVDVVWDDYGISRRVPEALVRGGVQWRVYDDVASLEEVAAALAGGAIKDASLRAKADEAAAAMRAAMAAAEKSGRALGLVPAAEFRDSGRRGSPVAWNVRRHLKAVGIKASVVELYHGSIRVRVDASSADRLDEAKIICGRYEAGSFNGMSDCYEYDPSAWGNVFGDARFVNVH